MDGVGEKSGWEEMEMAMEMEMEMAMEMAMEMEMQEAQVNCVSGANTSFAHALSTEKQRAASWRDGIARTSGGLDLLYIIYLRGVYHIPRSSKPSMSRYRVSQ